LIPRSHFSQHYVKYRGDRKLTVSELNIKDSTARKMRQVSELLDSVVNTARDLKAHDLFIVSTLVMLSAEIEQAKNVGELALGAKHFLDFCLAISGSQKKHDIVVNERVGDRANLMAELGMELLHRENIKFMVDDTCITVDPLKLDLKNMLSKNLSKSSELSLRRMQFGNKIQLEEERRHRLTEAVLLPDADLYRNLFGGEQRTGNSQTESAGEGLNESQLMLLQGKAFHQQINILCSPINNGPTKTFVGKLDGEFERATTAVSRSECTEALKNIHFLCLGASENNEIKEAIQKKALQMVGWAHAELSYITTEKMIEAAEAPRNSSTSKSSSAEDADFGKLKNAAEGDAAFWEFQKSLERLLTANPYRTNCFREASLIKTHYMKLQRGSNRATKEDPVDKNTLVEDLKFLHYHLMFCLDSEEVDATSPIRPKLTRLQTWVKSELRNAALAVRH